ncbi:glutamate racemase [Marinobacter daqiaonensis]|uniref:Glutamate racemase n=1 Tax=Marinobacter daqiaonensis TaxID=650891 RepID=A0A1I6J8K2_9GAMM|nr:glutamate racemase [Marinobacter daqiaonensis]SFR75313.1 glutamate racemase [Marinobacter daqiaonensis]
MSHRSAEEGRGRAPEILVFDSGIGGLSIAGCIHRQIPGARLTHLADNAGFPYGNQPETTVIERTIGLVREQLARQSYDVVVVACNTASTVALPDLRAAVPVPVVGVVPAIKPAAAQSGNRRIGLLATPATVRRPYLETLIADFASDCVIERIGHPELVTWIEQWARGRPLPEPALAIALRPFRDAGVDTVVLGCTHYPLITPVLRRLLPDVLFWVDSGEAIARRTLSLLQQAGFDHHELAGDEATGHGCRFSGPVGGEIDRFLASQGFRRTSVPSG